jgi:hypothetical protein
MYSSFATTEQKSNGQFQHTAYRIVRVGFEVLTAVVMKSSTFWDITQYIPLKVDRRFEQTCRLHLQDRRKSQARNQDSAGFFLGLVFDPENGDDMVLLNVG